MNTQTENPTSITDSADTRGALIELDSLSWHHPGRENPTLNSLSLTIKPGEKVLLLGPSGAGKSTLLHAIAGVLYDQDGQSASGSITINGVPAEQARGLIALMQQDPESSVVLSRVGDDVAFGAENMAVEPSQIWQRVQESLNAVGLGHLELERSTAALSGGQKQRLGLAGILAMRPAALALDEPTANLDPEGVIEVRDAVLAAASTTGATLLVVEHRVGIWSPFMDRVIVLGTDGTISHDGTPEQVLGAARDELIAGGVWVPEYEPELPAFSAPAPGRSLIAARKLGISRVTPTRKSLKIRRAQVKKHPEPIELNLEAVKNYTPQALRDITELSLHEGEHISLLGPNGAGKSTLALTLAGLLYPVAGRLEASRALRTARGGEKIQAHWDIASWNPAQLVSRIGYVFQEPEYQFVTSRVRDELQVGPRRVAALEHRTVDEAELAARTDELLERLRLTHVQDANPFTLSGGEKRRLSVATALATRPQVLILDEPTFGQDARTWAELVQLIRRLVSEGVAVLSITHDEAYTRALGGAHIRLENVHSMTNGLQAEENTHE
ncbi:MAG: ATP-binding cassette domain-containing protein [Rothia sp. (in: high G+C Gram-positive bacteria)]|uniref:ABC transporter ATP-binding protein n=1 Tax=Rothia sp. (in: high G+C Gram-positive bacteria) TaxID=1885016 RepID=UPI0026E02C6A|nr:ABC transporter ATP-binding protein [Rothia sp. (in: high G+C Gram-positive bacteria)]MDO5750217.1 ATP-binding cassette domain-containing protein [Rothia sp. (in: high G+C Gram-positive bacteria)]